MSQVEIELEGSDDYSRTKIWVLEILFADCANQSLKTMKFQQVLNLLNQLRKEVVDGEGRRLDTTMLKSKV